MAKEKFLRPYCHVCRHYVRNTLQHNQSLEHRRKLNPHARVTKKARRAAHRRSIRGRKQEDQYVHVGRYRRSPPADGKRKTVKVVDHWRPLPGVGVSKADRKRQEQDELARFAARVRDSLLPWSQRSTT